MDKCAYCGTDITRGVYCPKCGMKNTKPASYAMTGLKAMFWYAAIGGGVIFLLIILSALKVI